MEIFWLPGKTGIKKMEKKSIKEYTRFVMEQLRPGDTFTDEEIDALMMSFGFEYNQEVE